MSPELPQRPPSMLLSFPPTSVPFIPLPFGHLCDAGGFFSALRVQPWHSIAVNSIASYTFPDTYGSTPAQSAVSPILCPSPLSVSWFSWLPMDISFTGLFFSALPHVAKLFPHIPAHFPHHLLTHIHIAETLVSGLACLFCALVLCQ